VPTTVKKPAADLVAGDTYVVTDIVGIDLTTGEEYPLPDRHYVVVESLGRTPWGATRAVIRKAGSDQCHVHRFAEGERVDVPA
jgi:hypothetical protein